MKLHSFLKSGSYFFAGISAIALLGALISGHVLGIIIFALLGVVMTYLAQNSQKLIKG